MTCHNFTDLANAYCVNLMFIARKNRYFMRIVPYLNCTL
uniref:Uncharacterized protein n=1 Tax=Anguilla anguilla TaxID=7936 RepID=A0A0E9V2X5_ANGAN